MPGMPEQVGNDEEHVGHCLRNCTGSQGPEGGRRNGAPRKARSRLLRAGGGALFRRLPDDGINLKFTCDPKMPCMGLRGRLTLQVRAKRLHLGLSCCLEVLLLQIGVAGEFQVAGDARTGRE